MAKDNGIWIVVGILVFIIAFPYLKQAFLQFAITPLEYNSVTTTQTSLDSNQVTYDLQFTSRGTPSTECNEVSVDEGSFTLDTFQGPEPYGDKLVSLPDYVSGYVSPSKTNNVEFTGVGAIYRSCSDLATTDGVTLVYEKKEAECSLNKEVQGSYSKARLICTVRYRVHAELNGQPVNAYIYGLNGGKVTVSFYTNPPENNITIYRLSNNLCNLLIIPESQRTANDYDSLSECSSHIIQNNVTNITTCVPSWDCINWSSCVDNIQTRTCNDLNNCNNLTGKPVTSQSCGITCNSNWSCGSWSTCSSNIQTRTCSDLNHCGFVAGKPSTTQSCGNESFFNKVIFKIGGFEVTMLYLMIVGGVVVLIFLIPRKK